MTEELPVTKTKTVCYHCGDTCSLLVLTDDKPFCCEGCKQVYLLLNETGLCNYYVLESTPGIKAKGKYSGHRFAYLDNEEISKKLLRFRDEKHSHVQFYLPTMHCSSCIWLLENLHRINAEIISSTTNFQRKEVFIVIRHDHVSLRQVVELLAFVGYEPYISLDDGEKKAEKNISRKHIYKIGIAGFCFSNIMMLSFPEYFSSGNIGLELLRQVFTYLSLALSIPVLLYSASEFFSSGYKGLRQGWLNIDAPIALAILIAFGRSLYEILGGTGPGYLDSMSGIVFFMLVGRWFQNRTYDALSFDRDYKSYFPLGVTVVNAGAEKNVPLTDLKKGDFIRIRNEEMIPSDGMLVKGQGNIDYSFVSGETSPVTKKTGDLIYAGGKQIGPAIVMEVTTPVSQSYITRLWNNDIFQEHKHREKSFIHPWSRYFTYILFSIAACSAIYWGINEPSKLWPSVTAVLIVACPCSLLLSSTFTYGSMLGILGKNKLYLKNANVIESLGKVDTIVFDKTGTLTHHHSSQVRFIGERLSGEDIKIIRMVTQHSSHPLSKIISTSLEEMSSDEHTMDDFREVTGKGLMARVNQRLVKIGSFEFVGQTQKRGEEGTQRNEGRDMQRHQEGISSGCEDDISQGRGEESAIHNPQSAILPGAGVYVSFDDTVKGHFLVNNKYRNGIKNMAGELRQDGYNVLVLSGDNNHEKKNLSNIFGDDTCFYFRKKPQEKLEFIREQQYSGKNVLMLGDGLNDAGALRQAQVGIAVSDTGNVFSPASDAILDGTAVQQLGGMLRFARSSKKIITASFVLSILYNIVGLTFATRGMLSPMIAAILMPASSISIVLLVSLSAKISARMNRLT